MTSPEPLPDDQIRIPHKPANSNFATTSTSTFHSHQRTFNLYHNHTIAHSRPRASEARQPLLVLTVLPLVVIVFVLFYREAYSLFTGKEFVWTSSPALTTSAHDSSSFFAQAMPGLSSLICQFKDSCDIRKRSAERYVIDISPSWYPKVRRLHCRIQRRPSRESQGPSLEACVRRFSWFVRFLLAHT